eukprot:gene24987-30185_t
MIITQILSNIIQFIITGYAAYHRYGKTGLSAMLVSGGVLGTAILNLFFSNWWSAVSAPEVSRGWLGLPSITNAVNYVAAAAGQEPPFIMLGKSTPIYALYGSKVVLMTKHLIEDVSAIQTDNKLASLALTKSGVRLLQDLPFFFGVAKVLKEEFIDDALKKDDEEGIASLLMPKTMTTGHFNHVKGMLAGIAVTALTLLPGLLARSS